MRFPNVALLPSRNIFYTLPVLKIVVYVKALVVLPVLFYDCSKDMLHVMIFYPSNHLLWQSNFMEIVDPVQTKVNMAIFSCWRNYPI